MVVDERTKRENEQLRVQIQQLQAQLSDGGHRRRLRDNDDEAAMFQQLSHELLSVTQMISFIQQKVNESSSAALTPPKCQDPTCLTGTPRSTNGCGNDAMGQYHSWAMQALQDLYGAG